MRRQPEKADPRNRAPGCARQKEEATGTRVETDSNRVPFFCLVFFASPPEESAGLGCYNPGMDENDDDFQAETYRLERGGSAYRLTHRPSGLSVVDNGPSKDPIIERWAALRVKLLALIREAD